MPAGRPSSYTRAMPMLRCRFGPFDYLLPLARVVEIVRHTRPTPVPGSPPWIVGVMNLRGRIHTVIDLGIKLGSEATSPDEKTCIVFVHPPEPESGLPLGLVAGRVATILDLKRGDLDPPRSRPGRLRLEFLEGSFRTPEGLAFVPNLDRILTAQDVLDPETPPLAPGASGA